MPRVEQTSPRPNDPFLFPFFPVHPSNAYSMNISAMSPWAYAYFYDASIPFDTSASFLPKKFLSFMIYFGKRIDGWMAAQQSPAEDSPSVSLVLLKNDGKNWEWCVFKLRWGCAWTFGVLLLDLYKNHECLIIITFTNYFNTDNYLVGWSYMYGKKLNFLKISSDPLRSFQIV